MSSQPTQPAVTFPASPSAMVQVEQAKAIQEIQAALVIAKKFPRDQNLAYTRIMQSCQRLSLAEQALYAYPRGDELVEGPSIRMAEMLAQNWGNIDFGVREIEQRDGASVCQSYCWDMETNTRQTKEFTVPHKRFTKKGSYVLKDPRDIYELVANYGARRLRACILGVIPGDIVEAAVNQVKVTLEKGSGEPLVDRIRKMVAAFADLGVTPGMIEKRLGHKVDVTTATEIVKLLAVYKSIRDGFSKREEYFEFPTEQNADEKAAGINESLGVGETKEQPQAAKPAADDPAISEQQVVALRKLLGELNVDEKTFCRFCRVEQLELLPARKYGGAVAELEKKRKRNHPPTEPQKAQESVNVSAN